ncbi:unnamed protein product [Linum tenue]|uniref:tRNA-binding domain-containing protein n=1 Tax=Linum tenue TaxID=586396 RepID=A0AAV0IJ83_9ROSI|nr:unnamed protein product [Linum tenue]
MALATATSSAKTAASAAAAVIMRVNPLPALISRSPPSIRCSLARIHVPPLTTTSVAKSMAPQQSPISRGISPFVSFCTAAEGSTTATAADGGEIQKKEETEGGGSGSIKDVANLLDLRVGKIIKAWRHEEADSLYVEEVDVGEAEPRIICSGLVKYIPLQHLQDRKVVVLANLKPRNMRGVKSNGMLMAASDAAHENVELLEPPEGSIPGERIWFGSEDDKDAQPEAASPNQIQKKKIWESVQPHLKTNNAGIAVLGGDDDREMRTSAGVVVSKTLSNANIS